ncbi:MULTISPECIES: hypothetical protein [unclassified Pseudoxanthomonas]|uniref:hypothetical protein n=1 Tax=unclassified Pseudoxanthomonas TaxID=2645906 RepID=UPI00307E5FB2
MQVHRTVVMASLILFVAACAEPATPPASEPVVEPAPEASAQPVPAPVEAAAPTAAQKYEGKIIKRPAAQGGKEDGWYVVKDGERRWIRDSSWLSQNGFKPEDVIQVTVEEFDSIAENPLPADVVVAPPAQ